MKYCTHLDNLLHRLSHGIKCALGLSISRWHRHSNIVIIISIIVGGNRSHVSIVFARLGARLVQLAVEVASTLQQSDTLRRLCLGRNLLPLSLQILDLGLDGCKREGRQG